MKFITALFAFVAVLATSTMAETVDTAAADVTVPEANDQGADTPNLRGLASDEGPEGDGNGNQCSLCKDDDAA